LNVKVEQQKMPGRAEFDNEGCFPTGIAGGGENHIGIKED